MLSWLKEILGESHTEEIEQRISREIGKGFVSKADFNSKNEALKGLEEQVRERDRQLEELKKSTGDIDALKQQISDLQAQNAAAKKDYENELFRIRMDSAVEAALTSAGAKNVTAAKALLAEFLKDAKMSDDGTVKGLSDEIETLAKAEGTSFMFEAAGTRQPGFKGMAPGTVGAKIPPAVGKEPKDMNYDELCAYLEANPGAKLE